VLNKEVRKGVVRILSFRQLEAFLSVVVRATGKGKDGGLASTILSGNCRYRVLKGDV